MQRVAAEMRHAETAFLQMGSRAESGVVGLRWFTPRVEVALCGHATLASAHALWSEGLVPSSETIEFATKSGPLHARRDDDGLGIRLDFPVRPLVGADPPAEVLAAIRTAPVSTWRCELPGEDPIWLLELAEERLV